MDYNGIWLVKMALTVVIHHKNIIRFTKSVIFCKYNI